MPIARSVAWLWLAVAGALGGCFSAETLAGVVVNDTMNLRRRERDRLRATLFNAARSGLDVKNRDDRPEFRRYLGGRVAWAASLNPGFGRRAKRLLAGVDGAT